MICHQLYGTFTMIRYALLAPGASPVTPSKGKGVNETWHGRVHLLDLSTRLAYVKFLNGKQMANELLAGELARLVGLKAPEPFLVRIEAGDYPEAFSRLGIREQAVSVFGCEALPAHSLARRWKEAGPAIIKWFLDHCPDWRKTIAFDAWVGNGDRHLGNLLVSSTNELWLIDHGHAFTGPDWNSADLLPEKDIHSRLFNDLAGFLTLDHRHTIMSDAPDIQFKAKIVDLEGALQDTGAESCVTFEEHDALLLYLQRRRDLIEELVGRIVGIPKLPLANP